ncbi:MAG: lipoyl synthase [Deltaproteobacteria bacterium]|nr:lipoyl synthase [Deltaproteobacteria bacterium]MBW2138282.1 lipoyl synthase [Deltaproteobacteria bacterium]
MKASKPEWLRKRVVTGRVYRNVLDLLKKSGLHTVCQEAHCPNLGECFAQGTSTFMILGDRCTRGCTFCAVRQDVPLPLDGEEPEKVAEAVRELGLRYAVITSVTRDDLADGGASHFAKTVRSVKRRNPGTLVEVLIPDFMGSRRALEEVVGAGPEVINHNMETVPRLYPSVRPGAVYRRSLNLLRRVKEMDQRVVTKSGLMLGLGEGIGEIGGVFQDLRRAGCDLLTLGQYLAPSSVHRPVARFVPPDEFDRLKEKALGIGFKAVASGPFVRSSYHAGEMIKGLVERD